MIDLHARPVVPERRLMDLFDLTRAEAALTTQLMQGLRPEDIAERSGVRISTVRTQLRAVLAKTNTSRQAELIRLLLRTSGPPASG